MKDYYYILGISKEATIVEIQQAYQKLALKFHPDNNGGDSFFASHYEKIKEAYLVLSDDHKRFRYDKARTNDISEELHLILDGPAPVITSFFASKKAGKKGGLLTISWEVLNAEFVHISLIGEVASNGTQTIRLEEENETTKFLTIILKARNSQSAKETVKDLKIKNLDYNENFDILGSNKPPTSKVKPTKPSFVPNFSKKANKKGRLDVDEDDDDDFEELAKLRSDNKKKGREKTEGRRDDLGIAYLLVAIMIFIIVLLLYTMHQINPMF